MIQDLDKLEIWKKAKDFAVLVYRDVLPSLPNEEKWNLASQLRRAAQSVPANIAEGYGRYYYQDNVRFCYIARGSLTEIQSHLALAHELTFISTNVYERLTLEGESLARMINGYIAYLKRSKRGAREPGADYAVREIPAPYPDNDLP